MKPLSGLFQSDKYSGQIYLTVDKKYCFVSFYFNDDEMTNYSAKYQQIARDKFQSWDRSWIQIENGKGIYNLNSYQDSGEFVFL